MFVARALCRVREEHGCVSAYINFISHVVSEVSRPLPETRSDVGAKREMKINKSPSTHAHTGQKLLLRQHVKEEITLAGKKKRNERRKMKAH